MKLILWFLITVFAMGNTVEQGRASWYGAPFHGRSTANQERYNMFGISAAHRTLPFGSIIEIINMKNGKKIVARINDRGPFIRGRILDVSYGAAIRLGMVEDGVVPVKVVLLGERNGSNS